VGAGGGRGRGGGGGGVGPRSPQAALTRRRTRCRPLWPRWSPWPGAWEHGFRQGVAPCLV